MHHADDLDIRIFQNLLSAGTGPGLKLNRLEFIQVVSELATKIMGILNRS